nr:transcription elongation factor TFIIS [Ipomoea trifida]GMD53020.1 transcription elongation factor TFIIS-like [Ipomoea batatas]
MEKELVELYEVVKKAADGAAGDGGDAEEERCLDALKQLKKFPVNYNVLVSSQVGKSLRKLTKHPREKIKTLASDIVEIWKQIIVRETMKNKSGGNEKSEKAEPAIASPDEAKRYQRSNSSTKVEKVSKTDSEKVERTHHSASAKSEKVIKSERPMSEKKVESVDVVKTGKSSASAHVRVEKTTNAGKPSSFGANPAPPKLNALIYCKDADRDKIRELIAQALCKVIDEVDDDLKADVNACDPYRIAVQVETALYEKWGGSKGAQKFKYRSIMFNIKDGKNPDFRRKVLLGEFSPQSVPELTPEDMASDERQQQNEKIKEKALFNSERGGPGVASTNAFKCKKCGKKECTYYQLQTRSADEPMTTFVTCVNCDNRWKF